MCVNNGSPAHYLLLVQSHPTTDNTINVLADPCLIQMVNHCSKSVLVHLKELIIPFY
mgnify:CR=1 FL=1